MYLRPFLPPHLMKCIVGRRLTPKYIYILNSLTVNCPLIAPALKAQWSRRAVVLAARRDAATTPPAATPSPGTAPAMVRDGGKPTEAQVNAATRADASSPHAHAESHLVWSCQRLLSLTKRLGIFGILLSCHHPRCGSLHHSKQKPLCKAS